MSVVDLVGGLSSTGTQYNFTNMSNKTLFNAASTLENVGDISVDQMSAMQYVAQGGNSVSVNGAPSFGTTVLNESGSHDFLSEFQSIYHSMTSTGGSVGAGLSGSIASLMAMFQGVSAKRGELSTEA